MSKWDQRHMATAWHYAGMSGDTTQVGCVIVGSGNEVRAQGWNDLPRKVHDTPERRSREVPAGHARAPKYLFTVHAEANTVANASRYGAVLEGCTAYVTHHPCSQCAGLLIQAGVAAVVVGDGVTRMPAEEFEAAREVFADAGVTVREPATREDAA